MKSNYNYTIYACFIGYIVQAIINNFAPLLFLTFQRQYHVDLSQITLLVTVNFAVQLLVDLVSVKLVDFMGYRITMFIAHAAAAAGLVLLPLLPALLPDPFVGLLLAVVVYAVGGGLLEVAVSPIMQACPTGNKEKAMSMLHSFYCWGHVGVVLISTLFFFLFGLSNWWILACIWALVPLVNGLLFIKVPIASLLEDGAKGLSLRALGKEKLFWLFMVMMICAGASEQAVSQWASAFAEKGLGVSKTLGDLAGPAAFAFCMGLSRLLYGKMGERINLNRMMIVSGLLCIASYLCIALVPNPAISLIACAVCGFSVGIMWPGTFSKAAGEIGGGGTAMFALLALGGDIGCSGGPTLAGFVSGRFGDSIQMGILATIVFPILLVFGMVILKRFSKNNTCNI
ncbi:MAG: MFS transporter [Clostridium sp.]|nr:MFS transporter [Clostridium sp.]